MVCPKCKGKIQNVATVNVSWNEVYRRKKCLDCGHVFYTAEFEVEVTKRFKREWNLYEYKRNNRV